MFPHRYPSRGLSSLIDALVITVSLGFVIACAMAGCSTLARAQETASLDLSILSKLDTQPAPAAAPQANPDHLDLSILDRLGTPAATAADAADILDLTLLDELDAKPGKPAVKPSKAAMRSLGAASGVELGEEFGRTFCKPEMPQASIEIDYPTRASNWTYPGVGRSSLIQHLMTAQQHRGKFALDTLARLETAELLALHSDDHEGRRKPVTIADAPQKPAATNATGAGAVNDAPRSAGKTPTNASPSPSAWGNVTSFQWLDGSYRSSPQPGASYPTLGGVLIPLRGGTHQVYPQGQPLMLTPQASRPVVIRGNCPGGVCPVR